MKPAPFDFVQPTTLDGALDALRAEGARVAAGYQSLGPMLNLRLVQPARLVDVTRIPELRAVEETAEAVVLGACVTHAEIEDGIVPDRTAGALPAVAAGLAYRAVRNRGTIGGSVAHADPSADWLTALAAAGASVRVAGPDGVRRMAVEEFIRGAFDPALADGELVAAIEIPRFSAATRWGFWKYCRKVGEFAEAMCAVRIDGEPATARIALGATDGRPYVVDVAREILVDPTALEGVLETAGFDGDPIQARLHRAALGRAAAQATEGAPT